ncbi:hypothetical protein [Embleya sp. AB8]|uniref:hypothetical protein n=1 Tax=Embleya sp. AB8 TaxID=3156304 RepID=UPI003C791B93
MLVLLQDDAHVAGREADGAGDGVHGYAVSVGVGNRGAECGASGLAVLSVGVLLVVRRGCGVWVSALESVAFGGGCGQAHDSGLFDVDRLVGDVGHRSVS